MSVTYPTLEHVAMEARPYPTDILKDAETGLCLFAAAFLGHNDAIHMAEAGLRSTCVDIDEDRIDEMRALYPRDWSFITSDAWTFATAAQELDTFWDVVSCDTFTGDAMRQSLDSLPLWCSLAREAVTVTLTVGAPYTLVDGWKDSLYERGPGVYWLVLERA